MRSTRFFEILRPTYSAKGESAKGEFALCTVEAVGVVEVGNEIVNSVPRPTWL